MHETLNEMTSLGISLRGLLDRAERSLDAEPGSARVYLRAARALCESMSARGDRGRHAQPASQAGLGPGTLQSLLSHIDRNLAEHLTVAQLAAQVRLSKSYFSRSFHRALGETPHAFLMRRRIEHAMNLIGTTSLSLAEVAAECGLSDQPHLTRCFIRHLGMTPGRWRSAQRVDAQKSNFTAAVSRLPARPPARLVSSPASNRM